MKTNQNWLLSFALTALSAMGCAKDAPSWASDPTYSTGNYKHANKAQAARQASTRQTVSVTVPTTADAQLADYKKQRPNQAPAGGIVVEHTPSASLAERNYKIQIPVREEATQTGVSSRRAGTRKDSSAGVGNE